MGITTRSMTKRQKLLISEDKNKEDRLSALPDDIIFSILTRLSTKLSVSTSILAKRWRFLWAHVPCLGFRGKVNPDVIHMVMGRHKAKTMSGFGLADMSHCNEYQLETWISTAIERNVRTLWILRVTPGLPMCIFTCKTLVHLFLENRAGVLPSPVYLPSLKRLSLRRVTKQAEEYLPRLLSGCPVLEALNIFDSKFGCYNISSPSIKRLNFRFLFYCKTPPQVRVVINAPALRNLLLETFCYDQMSLSPMTSLIKAHVNLNGDSEQEGFFCSLSLSKLFYCFPNVKCLRLYGRCKEDDQVPAAGSSIVKFDKLTKLSLGVDWCFLTKFLETADNLEQLIIRQVCGSPRNWIEPEKQLLLRSLRIVTIHDFVFTEQELNFVKYILRNAKVLKRMEIHPRSNCDDSKETTIDTLKRILLFHRGSTECEVAFV